MNRVSPFQRTASLFLGVSVLVASAVLSLAVGFAFGQRALSGVSSPVVAPQDKPQAIRDPRTIPLVNEAEVIAKAKERLKSGIPTPPPTPTPTPPPVDLFAATPTPIPLELSPELAPAPVALTTPATSVPTNAVTTPSGSVQWQVLSVERRGDEVVLAVQIQNQSNETTRFLYSYLSVTNEANQAITARTQGLPGELPPRSNPFLGTIRIPVTALGSSRSLSLSLADYPNGQHRLEALNLPVP
ncbi:MAG: hypothetical protein OHK0012_18540 [Synechococcales cyanobacterium]